MNVKDYSMDSLMKNFSFVFQSVYLFQDTIANNIRLLSAVKIWVCRKMKSMPVWMQQQKS